jgi:hypothetical protein
MSANIKWKVVKPEGKSLNVSAPSSFLVAMERAFGTLPIILNANNIQILQGMAAVHGDGNNPFVKLIEILETIGDSSIEIWAEY